MLRELLFSCAFAATALPAAAVSFTLEKIVDTNTAIPDGTGNFTSLLWAVVDGDRIAFNGAGSSGQRGIYTNTPGGFVTVVNQSTALPGVTGGPNIIQDAVVDGKEIVFRSFVASGSDSGIYRNRIGSSLYEVIIDESTPVPDSPNTFGLMGGFDADNGVVVLEAQGGVGEEGIYRHDSGVLTTIANENTPIPSHDENFRYFSSINIDAGQIVFSGGGTDFHGGIYSDRNGAGFELVTERGDTAPRGQGQFIFFGFEPNIDDGDITFQAVNSVSSGIYLDDGSGVVRVADGNTDIPDGTGDFQGYHDWTSSDDGRVIFRGTGVNNQDGVYLADTNTDEIVKLIADGDILDGLEVDFVNMMPDAFDGDRIVLTVTFKSGGGSAIYLLTIPEPGSAALLGLGLLILTLRRRTA